MREVRTREPYDRLAHNGSPEERDWLDAGAAGVTEAVFGKGEMVRLYDSRGIFVGVYRYEPVKERFRLEKMFYDPECPTNEKRGVDSMKVISGIEAYDGNKKTAVTLGKFDGLHRGHQKLLEKVLSYRGDGCEAVVCAFDMHRDSLMTVRERRAHLSEKADWLIEQPLSRDFMSMEAETFIEQVLYRKLHAAHLVVGADFNFGRGRRGNARMLELFAGQYGYTVDVVDKERYLGTVISSTYIKDALAQGDVKLAEALLGYPYELTGIVRHGKQLGRTLGFPTMNIEPEEHKILPGSASTPAG